MHCRVDIDYKKELKMVSRRKILSRSRDELHSDIYYMAEDDDDDVWHSKDKLYRVRLIFNVYLYRDILTGEGCSFKIILSNTTS